MIVFLEGTNRIWTTWTLFQELIHSTCLSQSRRASGPHQLWKSHLRKHTGHSKLVSLSEQQTTGGNFTMKIKRHYWNQKVLLKCCSRNKKSIHVPQQYLEIWSMPSQSMTTSKESSFCLLFYSDEVLKCL